MAITDKHKHREMLAHLIGNCCTEIESLLSIYRDHVYPDERKAVLRAIDVLNEVCSELEGE